MTDFANWMGELWEHLEDRCIWHVMLPATHNSGVFSALNTIGVRNQDRSIGEQLQGGVRAFDIRVMKGHGTYVMHHNGLYPPDGSQHLEPALQQMKEFAAAHPREIMVVRLAGDRLNNDARDIKLVRDMLLRYLEPHLVPYVGADPQAYLLRKIREQNKNIVLLLSKCGQGCGPKNLFWPKGMLEDTWDGFQSDCCITPAEKMRRLKPHIEGYLRKREEKEPKQGFLYKSGLIWTINIYHAATFIVGPPLCQWLDEWSKNPALSPYMNIVAVDFFNTNNSQVIGKIVELNRNLPQDEPALQTDAAPP